MSPLVATDVTVDSDKSAQGLSLARAPATELTLGLAGGLPKGEQQSTDAAESQQPLGGMATPPAKARPLTAAAKKKAQRSLAKQAFVAGVIVMKRPAASSACPTPKRIKGLTDRVTCNIKSFMHMLLNCRHGVHCF